MQCWEVWPPSVRLPLAFPDGLLVLEALTNLPFSLSTLSFSRVSWEGKGFEDLEPKNTSQPQVQYLSTSIGKT